MISSKILQINVNRNAITTENVLNLAIELNISILAIQEPKIYNLDNKNTTRSVMHASFSQILPNYGLERPRVLYYISKSLRANISRDSPLDPDCIVIDILGLRLVNVYNNSSINQPNSTYTINREFFPNLIDKNTILLGDFNIHHPWWDPLAPKSTSADYLVDLIQTKELVLLNKPGKGTFYRPHMSYSTVIDLTLVYSAIYNKVRE